MKFGTLKVYIEEEATKIVEFQLLGDQQLNINKQKLAQNRTEWRAMGNAYSAVDYNRCD